MTTKTKAKKTTKKTTSKKTGKSAESKKQKPTLPCANSEQCFWTTDGRILSNLVELSDALKSMNKDVFEHHVKKDKNDFADWVENVLMDKELAKMLRKSRKPGSARTIVVRRLKIYGV